jgi:uncharacterized protein UPF0158
MPEHVDLGAVNIDELSEALQDQQDYEHWWTFDPRTCEFGYRSRYDPDYDEDEELDPELIVIEPYPSRVWYQDMVDFAEGLSDEHAARRLFRALDGRGAFRRFRNELYEEYPELVSVWQAFRTARAHRRAVEWLLDEDLIDEAVAERWAAEHPDPPVP